MPTKVFFCPFACFFSPSEFVSKKPVFNPYGRTGLPFRGKGKMKENKAISAKQGGLGGGSNDKALNMPDSHIHKTTTRSAGWLVAWPWVVSVVAWLSFPLGKEHQNIRAKESRELKEKIKAPVPTFATGAWFLNVLAGRAIMASLSFHREKRQDWTSEKEEEFIPIPTLSWRHGNFWSLWSMAVVLVHGIALSLQGRSRSILKSEVASLPPTISIFDKVFNSWW